MTMTTTHDHDDKRVAGDDSGHADLRNPHVRRFRRLRADDSSVSPEMLAAYFNAMHALEKSTAPGEQKVPWVMIGTAVTAVAAAIFAFLTYTSSATQDKVDRGTAPLNVQISEMDKRLTGRLDSSEKTLEKISTRLDSIEGRLSTMELRLERIDSKLTK